MQSLQTIPTLLAVTLLLLSYLTLGRGVATHSRMLYMLLRTGALIILLFVMAHPHDTITTTHTPREKTAILIDASPSMELPDSLRRGESRKVATDAILKNNAPAIAQLKNKTKLSFYSFASDLRELQLEDTKPIYPVDVQNATALGEALTQLLDTTRGSRLTDVLIISDGASNTGGSPLSATQELSRLGTRVHTLVVGEAGKIPDVEIKSMRAPKTAKPARAFKITAQLAVHAPVNMRQNIILYCDGLRQDTKQIRLSGNKGFYEIEFEYTPRCSGDVVIEVVATPQPGERITRNNYAMAFVNVLPPSLKLLYVEGTLRRDLNAIKSALSSFDEFELNTYHAFVKSTWPNTIPLAGVDVLILGEANRSSISEATFKELSSRLRNNSLGLLVISGPSTLGQLPIKNLLPATIAGQGAVVEAHLRPTETAANHPAFRLQTPRALSTPYEVADLATELRPKRGAEVLLKDALGNAALILSDKNANSRVALMPAGETYPTQDGKTFYRELLRSLVRWSAGLDEPPPPVTLFLRKHELNIDEKTQLVAILNTASLGGLGFSRSDIDSLMCELSIIGPLQPRHESSMFKAEGGTSRPLNIAVKNNRATTTITAPGVGTYRAVLRFRTPENKKLQAETLFVVKDSNRELLTLGSNAPLMRSIAKMGGGGFYTKRSAKKLFQELANRPEPKTKTIKRRVAIWDKPWLLMLFLLFLFAEWYMRRP